MKNKTKALLIPVAAFAVTVAGAQAFDVNTLNNFDLDSSQISAFEQARDLRLDGDIEAARDVLMDAGVDIDTLQEVKGAMQGYRGQMQEEIEDALHTGDYDAFLNAVEGAPMMESIDTPEEFDQVMEAFELRESGDMEAAQELMQELGFSGGMKAEQGHGMMKGGAGMHKGDPEARGNGFNY